MGIAGVLDQSKRGEHLSMLFGIANDELVKSRNSIKVVIPAKGGIQLFQHVLDPGFLRGDDPKGFFGSHYQRKALEISHAGLFVFSLGEEEPIILDPGLLRDFLGDPAAILSAFSVNHCIEVKRPIGKGRTEVTMADRGKGHNGLADLGDLFLRHFPDDHGVSLVSGFLMT
jgi:hypothetical protein